MVLLNNGFNPDLSGVNEAGKARAVGWGTNTYAPKGNYAPKPTTSTGVGQWQFISITKDIHNFTYLTLPAGGTWAYYIPEIVYETTRLNGLAGIAAGGTNVLYDTNTNHKYLTTIKALCYRIA